MKIEERSWVKIFLVEPIRFLPDFLQLLFSALYTVTNRDISIVQIIVNFDFKLSYEALISISILISQLITFSFQCNDLWPADHAIKQLRGGWQSGHIDSPVTLPDGTLCTTTEETVISWAENYQAVLNHPAASASTDSCNTRHLCARRCSNSRRSGKSNITSEKWEGRRHHNSVTQVC